MEIIVALGSVPKDGGTFTFYRNLRPALFGHGIDMSCVTMGWQEAQLWEDGYADDGLENGTWATGWRYPSSL